MNNFKDIEKKWQNYWENNKTFKFDKKNINKKLYCLEMFPYPSGAKLHMGHWWQYSIPDTWARMKKMQGFNVFHPIGFDAFGLPAENYAIKTGVHPQDSTTLNIETMEKQLRNIGIGYDWDYEIKTCFEDYYKWTQWMFLKLYEHNLAYKKEAPVNYCPSCKTVLANEQVISGKCERCSSDVIAKKMSQWFFKITDYAEELLNDLDKLDWPERTKILQKNWIGKSQGAEVTFKVKDTDYEFNVFTTRVDTLYGCSYVVLAPENDLVDKITTSDCKDAVESYKTATAKMKEIDRLSTVKEKTGVFTGSYAINPINNEIVPIWIADYVIASYGTGCVMAVPAHDERDYDFATKYNLKITRVVNDKNNNETELPFIEYGVSTNSEDVTGSTTEETKKKIIKKLEKINCGKSIINYRMRDWLVSRQRYWGAPIPIVYCEKCGIVPVPETELPVKLPYNVEFKPDGSSPLAKSDEFMHTTCPKCGGNATREADTLDTFVCSSWYFLRFPDNKNDKMPFDKELINNILPVDKYIGGVEHVCMHLLYARFFTKALRDMGYLNFDEPFKSLVHQGFVLGPDGEKMSKSKGNTVAPEEYVEKYGSDVLRMYLMFGFNYLDGGPWCDDGALAIDRFVKRLIRIFESNKDKSGIQIDEVDKVLNQSIKCIVTDVDKFQFNTAVSKIMEYVNVLYKYIDKIDKHYIEQLVLVVAPFLPHLAEEMWEQLGYNTSVFEEKYPTYDESKLHDDTYELVVQVNGKIRGKIITSINTTEEEMKSLALSEPNVKNYVDGKEIVKIVIIPKKLVSIVIK